MGGGGVHKIFQGGTRGLKNTHSDIQIVMFTRQKKMSFHGGKNLASQKTTLCEININLT